MNTINLKKKFEKMKAGFNVIPNAPQRSFRRVAENNYRINVEGGVFTITSNDSTLDVNIVDQDVKDRHILLNVGRKVERPKGGGFETITEKWLCGHDERDWFVGAIEGSAKNIWEAKQSLKPKEVIEAEKDLRIKTKHKRKNKARLRQGEWFFVPKPDLIVPEFMTHKDEKISRGRGSKPHIVEEVYRTGGKSVWVRGGSVVTDKEYEQSTNKAGYTQRVADATVYGRGYVKHKDHATIYLDGWHQILMNTERGRTNLDFLD